MLSMKRRIASVVSAPSGGGANGPFFDSMSSRMTELKLGHSATLARARRFGREERRRGAHEAPPDDDDSGQHAERKSLRGRRDARVPEKFQVRPLHEPDAAEADGKR